MRSLILIILSLFAFSSSFALAEVCYAPSSCFTTNYACNDFKCYTEDPPSCTCDEFEQMTITDELDVIYDVRDNSGTLQVKEGSSTTWDNIYNLTTNIASNEVFRITISCEFEQVTLTIYDGDLLEEGKTESESYLRTVNISYTNASC